MEPRLFKYIWHHSRREQLAILLMVVISLPFLYMSFNLPKSIVNEGIQGEGFSGEGSTQSFLRIGSPWGAEGETLFEGFQLNQPSLLIALSLTFLSLVVINGVFKFVINTEKGRTGERMLRRLRYELTDRVLRFPIPHLRRMKQSEVATMIKDEVEPLGGFIGDAYVQPVYLGGQALTAMVFILVQSVWLGLVAATIVLVQAFVIPRLRRRILVLGKERQLTARQLAGRIGELIEGAVEVHAHDTSNYERADIASRLGRIFGIRYEIYQRKFFVKFLNNFLSQLTPFLFYMVGGLLAIAGHMDIGALVAVINAYKDLPGPIKELIDWDQQRNDVQIKYDQVIEQFQGGDILSPEAQSIDNDPNGPLDGDLQLSAVALTDENDTRLVEGINLNAPLSEHIAVVGDSASGKEHLGQLIAGLVRPSAGEIAFNGATLSNMPQSVTGRRLSYVGPDAYLFPVSVRDNLLYGLKHRPGDENGIRPSEDGAAGELLEALRAGNPTFDINADWVDYRAAGVEGPEALDVRLAEVLRVVDMEADVYRFGLTGTIDPEANPETAEGILRARAALVEQLRERGVEDLVIRFDPEAYNVNASVAENLLFGTPTKPEYRAHNLAENPVLIRVLDEAGLTKEALEMGLSIARTMVEIFADLPPGHPFFEQFSFIDADDLPDTRLLVSRAEKSGVGALPEADRKRLMSLPFGYVEARHRLSLMGPEAQQKVIEARKLFAERLAEADPGAVEAYDPNAYNAAASLQDNILFGRLAYGRAQAQETVGAAMTEVLDALGLRESVIIVGLDYNVGVSGKRLSPAQRQKLAIARAILKRPDVLILNEAAAVMDGVTQARLLERILEARRDNGLIWTLQQPDAARHFDRVLVMQSGRLVEQGTYTELNEPDTAFTRLVNNA